MYIKSAAAITFFEPSQCGTVELIGMPRPCSGYSLAYTPQLGPRTPWNNIAYGLSEGGWGLVWHCQTLAWWWWLYGLTA